MFFDENIMLEGLRLTKKKPGDVAGILEPLSGIFDDDESEDDVDEKYGVEILLPDLHSWG